jgi:hypothetical protein
MAWEVLRAAEFDQWWNSLDADEQERLRDSIRLLSQFGPTLSRPHADTVGGSKHPNMKELRTQHRGRPLRTFFAFDPIRRAVLLIGGDKTGDKRFYDRMIPWADAIFDAHLAAMKRRQDQERGKP